MFFWGSETLHHLPYTRAGFIEDAFTLWRQERKKTPNLTDTLTGLAVTEQEMDFWGRGRLFRENIDPVFGSCEISPFHTVDH